MASRRSSQPVAALASPASSARRPSASNASVVGSRSATSAQAAAARRGSRRFFSARRASSAHSVADGRRLLLVGQDRGLLLVHVGQLRRFPLRQQDVRQPPHRLHVSRPFGQVGAQDLGGVALFLEQPRQPHDLQAQLQAAGAVLCRLQLGEPQRRRVGEAPLALVEPRQRLPRRRVGRSLVVQRPPYADGAGRVGQLILRQLRGAPQPAATGLGGGREPRPLQQHRRRPADPLGAAGRHVQPDALVDGVGGRIERRLGAGAPGSELRQPRGALGELAQELDGPGFVRLRQRHGRCLAQEVEIVRLLVGEPLQRLDQPVAAARALHLRALLQRRNVPGLGAQRPGQRRLGRRGILTLAEQRGGDARVHLAPRGRLQLGGLIGSVRQRGRRGRERPRLAGQRLVERQQHVGARRRRDRRVDEQGGRRRQIAQADGHAQRPAARCQALGRDGQRRLVTGARTDQIADVLLQQRSAPFVKVRQRQRVPPAAGDGAGQRLGGPRRASRRLGQPQHLSLERQVLARQRQRLTEPFERARPIARPFLGDPGRLLEQPRPGAVRLPAPPAGGGPGPAAAASRRSARPPAPAARPRAAPGPRR